MEQNLPEMQGLAFWLVLMILGCLSALSLMLLKNLKWGAAALQPQHLDQENLDEAEGYLLRQCLIAEYSKALENERLTFDPTLREGYRKRRLAISALYIKLTREEIKAEEQGGRPHTVEDRCAADSHMWIGSN